MIFWQKSLEPETEVKCNSGVYLKSAPHPFLYSMYDSPVAVVMSHTNTNTNPNPNPNLKSNCVGTEKETGCGARFR